MTGNREPISRVAICGKSDDLWPAVALIARHLPERIKLIVIEDNSEPSMPNGITLPWENRFHENIGLDGKDLIQSCDGRLGLGIDFVDWQDDDSSFFQAPSGRLPLINGVEVHHVMLRAAQIQGEREKLAYLFQPFRFCARAALAGKFAFPSDASRSPTAMLGPTLQLDRAQYTKLLKERSKSSGTEIHQARPVAANLSPENGVLISIETDQKTTVDADWFIDISGALSSLLPQEEPKTSSVAWLPFDRKISGFAKSVNGRPHDHVVTRALQGGLLIETPVGGDVIKDLYFSADNIDEATAKEITGNTSPPTAFKQKLFENPWTGNLARLGPASVELGPHPSAGTLALQQQLLQIIELIPANQEMDAEAQAFNQRQKNSMEEIRDFSLMPFILNDRKDDFWSGIRNNDIPASLRLRIDQFKNRGRFVEYENEIFDHQAWIDMMIGFGIIPERYDPMTESIDMKKIVPVLRKIVDDFNKTIDSMATLEKEMQNILA